MSEPRFFRTDQVHEWSTKLLALAELNLPSKSIADNFGCSYKTLIDNPDVMLIIRAGWSNYRIRIETEIYRLATEEIPEFADPVEKGLIRASKTKMLALVHKVLHADPWVPPAEVEKLRRLTDEELAFEIEKAAENLRPALRQRR